MSEHKAFTDNFSSMVFSRSEMRKRLPKAVYEGYLKSVDNFEPLHPDLADSVATAMKDWALERGCTHYTHWFQPLTGFTAEKHDTFLEADNDGRAICEFSGKNLVQGEPDASSFPSGGLRATFEARGYTGWDPSSPAFIRTGIDASTLCIPTTFFSYTGEALDKKTPLLRSNEAISKAATRLLKLFGMKSNVVRPTVGPEQEYFLIPSELYEARPDLRACGRTLFGAPPAKGQQLDDHYFGAIRPDILDTMQDVENELYKLGVPLKTRHNEVAPSQYEMAPIYERSTLAADHNMLVMQVLREVSVKNGYACLLHEKPFAGVNGSGKHLNYSLENEDGENLLTPGNTPEDNLHFLAILTAMIRAVNLHSDVLRASVASAGNDHRLGANEAPPAIISIFLGAQLTAVVESIIKGSPVVPGKKESYKIGVTTMPDLQKDVTDRNRTSPFAFTGNKFEFRAVGSNDNISGSTIVLNTIFAESINDIADRIEKEQKSSKSVDAAAAKVIKEILTENQRIIFNGDNYSEEWHKEAEKRGLPNLKTTTDALQTLAKDKTKKLFKDQNVLSEAELESRRCTYLEQYVLRIEIEARTMLDIARTLIAPAATGHLNSLSASIKSLKENKLPTTELSKNLQKVAEALEALLLGSDELEASLSGLQEGDDVNHHAEYVRDVIVPNMQKLRQPGDILETLVDDALWPLPKYRDLLGT